MPEQIKVVAAANKEAAMLAKHCRATLKAMYADGFSPLEAVYHLVDDPYHAGPVTRLDAFAMVYLECKRKNYLVKESGYVH